MNTYKNEAKARKAQNFLLKSSDAFSEKTPRNTVNRIGITYCSESEGDEPSAMKYEIGGAATAKTPTGKLKTYSYKAVVVVNGENECFFESLKLIDDQI